jgi:hypothetical protein
MHSLFQNIGSSLPLGGEGLSVGGQAFSDGTVEHLLGQEGTSIKRRAFPNNRMAFASLSGSVATGSGADGQLFHEFYSCFRPAAGFMIVGGGGDPNDTPYSRRKD